MKKITLEKAREIINKNIIALPSQMIELSKSLNCTLDEDIISKEDSPPFSRSPYDGYALCAEDTKVIINREACYLKIVGSCEAGHKNVDEIKSGEAVRIFTGGYIPKGANCVIKQEETIVQDNYVKICKFMHPYENYCVQGEDFKVGTLLVEKGQIVDSRITTVSGNAGYEKLRCIPKPKVGIVTTGDELQSVGTILQEGKIYDVNAIFIQSRLQEMGINEIEIMYSKDDVNTLMEKIESCLTKNDILITTGGVSVGEKDYIHDVLEKMGAKILFHGVEIKPGMPTLFAMLGKKPIISLSGNPFAAIVGFELLVRHILFNLTNNNKIIPEVKIAKMKSEYHNKGQMRRFLRGKLEYNKVIIPDKQGNGQLKTLLGCNCLVEIPISKSFLKVGDSVMVHLL